MKHHSQRPVLPGLFMVQIQELPTAPFDGATFQPAHPLLSDQLCSCGCGRFTLKSDANRDGYTKDQPRQFLKGHNHRLPTVVSYRWGRNEQGVYLHFHRLRAERALGKPLPAGAVVHHADGSRSEDAPLVICQDQAYHRLLHARMRVKALGGNPNTEKICSTCKMPKPFELFAERQIGYMGRQSRCKSCVSWHEMFRVRDYSKKTI